MNPPYPARAEGLVGARVVFREELEQYDDSYPRLKSLADVLYLRGNQKEAGDLYARSAAEPEVTNDLNLIEARIWICADSAAFADARESLSVFEKETTHSPEVARTNTALACFERSAQLDPTNYLALNNAGTILLNVHHDKTCPRGFAVHPP
jgi:tetratricopeptide (TPR) repeat protein